jgi:hypothetical protein
LTARAAILAVALASVALALALPFKVWLGQRNEIAALRAQTRAQEQSVAQLQRQQQLWQDPAYVRQQAQLRLHFILPGHTNRVLLSAPPARKHASHTTQPATPDVSGPWFARLWQTVQAAGAKP